MARFYRISTTTKRGDGRSTRTQHVRATATADVLEPVARSLKPLDVTLISIRPCSEAEFIRNTRSD